MERRRTFSREFKLEAVRLVTERGVAVAQAAKDLTSRGNAGKRLRISSGTTQRKYQMPWRLLKM